jgi:predicted regulator of Ras-like GTPase activity (Roadblock/LC7/MglB family)
MFKEPLEAIVQATEGGLGALIMGRDGIAVEKVLTTEGREANLDVAAAEFTSLVRNAQRSGNDTGQGGLREVMVGYEKTTVLIRLISQDYFIVLAIAPDGNIGRGRFELRKAELRLSKEFAL